MPRNNGKKQKQRKKKSNIEGKPALAEKKKTTTNALAAEKEKKGLARRLSRTLFRTLSGTFVSVSSSLIKRNTNALEGSEGRWKLGRVLRKPPQLVRWDLLGVSLSYFWGALNSCTLPTWCRAPLYKVWAHTFKANLDEIKEPLESYATLRDFFSRSLKEGVRPIANEPLVSPVDGTVVTFGEVLEDRVEQVKGMTYSISGFLGSSIGEFQKIKNSKLYHAVLYLAPGDYHRIHSPADWIINQRRHFPGTLFPVAPHTFGKVIPNLLALNERIVLTGEWTQGFFSLSAVGAYNVGSIQLKFDEEVRTNDIYRDFICPNLQYFTYAGIGSYNYQHTYENPIYAKKGEELGLFNLGSTVVLIFEAENFEFNIKCGDKVQVGKQLGTFL